MTDVASASSTGNRRYPLCDAARAVAALAIVVFHCGRAEQVRQHHWWGALIDHLEIGVTVFFVLSGFLLYRPFVVRRSTGETSDMRRYAEHRVRRIVPAYWVALTLLAIWPGLHGVFTSDWWRFYGFAQIYENRTFLWGIPPAWSLNVEVVFYVMLPLYVVAAARGLRRVRSRARVPIEMGLIVAVLVLASLVRQVPFLERSVADAHLTFALVYLPRTFDWFLYGLLLALATVAWSTGTRPRSLSALASRPGACWAAALAGYVVVSYVVPFEDRVLQHILFGPVALLVILPAVFDEVHGVPQRLLAVPALAWVGLVSYGIFLWHWPLVSPINAALGAGFLPLVAAVTTVAVILGAASHYLVERPFMRLGRR